MKKIGIITILKVNNYGAELQAYALQKKLNLLGYDAEIIDYLYYKNPRHKSERCALPFYPYPIKNRIKEWGLILRDKLIHLRSNKTLRKREQNFSDFHKTFNKISDVCYNCYSMLYNKAPQYDAYCVGSDQVWNPRCYTNLSPYFLTFAPKAANKFSYASSFGVSSIPKEAEKQYKEHLQQLRRISVRERTGVKIVERLTGQKAEVVVDPTLLLTKEEWNSVAKPIEGIPAKFLLIYELTPLAYVKQVAKVVAEKEGLKIVRISKDASSVDNDSEVINVADAGPSEFIWLLEQASFIVTNSFHGTAFSVNFNKDFYCILKQGKSNNSRQLDLLSSCKLSERIVYDGQNLPDLTYLHIDYSSAKTELEKMRSSSCNYLINAIDGSEYKNA